MMKNILFVLLFSSSSVYSFDGFWIGSGNSMTHRNERACSSIFFEFEVSATHVTLAHGGYVCGILQAEYPRSAFERGPGFELFYQGEMVGYFDGITLRLERPSDFFEVVFTLENQSLHYRELWDDGSSFLRIEGELRPVE